MDAQTNLINKINRHLCNMYNPTLEYQRNIVVFVGDLSLISPVTTAIVSDLLPTYWFNNNSPTIDIQHIAESTRYLKGHKFCVSFYHDSCFRFISPHEFLNNLVLYKWLERRVHQLYYHNSQRREICNIFSVEDAFQEVCLLYLDKILSKYKGQDSCNMDKITGEYDEQRNLCTFVSNRLRRYFQYIINKQLVIRQNELIAILKC